MKALSGMYKKSSANNKVHLMKKLFNLKMTENASVAQHLNEFNTITNQLSSAKVNTITDPCTDRFGFFAKQLGGNENGSK